MQIRETLLLQGDAQHGDVTELKIQNIKIEHGPRKEATWLKMSSLDKLNNCLVFLRKPVKLTNLNSLWSSTSNQSVM